MSTPETDSAKLQRLAREGVRKAAGERRGFTITKFGVHEDGYFHAFVVINGDRYYVHRRFGSWMAPGSISGRAVLKEVESICGGEISAMDIKRALQDKARPVEKARRAKTTDDEEVPTDADAGAQDEPVAAGTDAG